MTGEQQTLDVGIEPECTPEERVTRRVKDEKPSSPSFKIEEDDYLEYSGGDTHEATYTYYQSVCEVHPCPGRREPGESTHHQFSFVNFNGDESYESRLIETMTSERCSCGGKIEGKKVTGEWPLEDLTAESILELFRETNGQIVLEFYPRNWDIRFYIGEIGGRYSVETEEYGTPDLPTGVDDLVELVREHPNKLTDVHGTPLEGAFESYENGEV